MRTCGPAHAARDVLSMKLLVQPDLPEELGLLFSRPSQDGLHGTVLFVKAAQ